MLLAGDEFGHSQQGNNNAYCQDNPLSWIDWERAAQPAAQAQVAFVRRALSLRRRYGLRAGTGSCAANTMRRWACAISTGGIPMVAAWRKRTGMTQGCVRC